MALRPILGLLCAGVAALIWGGGAVVSRHLVTHSLDPLDLALLRYAGCFPIALLAVLGLGRRARLDLDWGRLAVLLMLAGPPYQLLLITGYAHATAGGGALLVSGLLPVFSFLIPLLSTNARPSPGVTLGAALAVAGLVVFNAGPAQAAFSDAGLFIFSLAAMLWAALNHLVRSWRIDPLRLTVALALWSPLFLPVYLVLRPSGFATAPPREIALQLVYHGWLVAFAATLLFFTAVRLAGLVTSSVLQALAPCLSAALGALLLAEPLSGQQQAGIAITTAGVMLTAAGGAVAARWRRS